MENLSVNEKAVLDYLKKSGENCNKSRIGVVVGKRQPKNASVWATPILDKLIEKGLIEQVEDGAKILYKAKENLSEQIVADEPEDEVDVLGAEDNDGDLFTGKSAIEDELLKDDDLRKQFPANIEGSEEFNKANESIEDDYESESPAETLDAVEKSEKKKRKSKSEQNGFSLPKAKKEITELTEKFISEMDEQLDTKAGCLNKALKEYVQTNGEIPEEHFQSVMRPLLKKYSPKVKKEKGAPRANILDCFDRQGLIEAFKITFDTMKADEKSDSEIKKQLFTEVTTHVAGSLSEKSMKANSVKSFIAGIVHFIMTGEERPFKSDGREFEKGQKVKYTNKHGEEKTGVIYRIFNDMVFMQRTIIVIEDGTDKKEMKIDTKIISVID